MLSALVHELMHFLGMDHEHCRIDRDNHVEIIKGNICRHFLSQFEICFNETIGLPYDYHSIMHYGRSAFAKATDKITMKPKAPEGQLLGSYEVYFEEIKNFNSLETLDGCELNLCDFLTELDICKLKRLYSLLKSNREEPTDLGNEFEDAIPYLQWRESCNIEIIGDGLKLKDIDFDKFPDKPPLLAKEMEDQRGRKLKRFYGISVYRKGKWKRRKGNRATE